MQHVSISSFAIPIETCGAFSIETSIKLICCVTYSAFKICFRVAPFFAIVSLPEILILPTNNGLPEIFDLNLPTVAEPRVRILDEPTAAALGYGAIAPNALVLVIDMGGGTLDLSLVRLPQHSNVEQWGEQVGSSQEQQEEYRAIAIAKSGYTVGGEDIDQWLMEDCLANYFEQSFDQSILEQSTKDEEVSNCRVGRSRRRGRVCV